MLVLTGAASPPTHAKSCPPPPPAVVDLDVPRFYSDARSSQIDAAQLAANRQSTAPLTQFLRAVTQAADAAVLTPEAGDRKAAAVCALSWLGRWAEQGAYLGRRETRQAEHQAKWDLAGLALAYLKVRAVAPPESRAVIERWLAAMADRARAHFEDARRTRNNHWYWLGLALGATAHATDQERYWLAARGIMADAARDIASDGTLPLELTRGQRALHYHAFAVTPLVALAVLARARGWDFVGLGDGALHRLVGTTAAALADPQAFEQRYGLPVQERPINPSAGWAGLYLRRLADRATPELERLRLTQPDRHRWLGGRIDALEIVLGTYQPPR